MLTELLIHYFYYAVLLNTQVLRIWESEHSKLSLVSGITKYLLNFFIIIEYWLYVDYYASQYVLKRHIRHSP